MDAWRMGRAHGYTSARVEASLVGLSKQQAPARPYSIDCAGVPLTRKAQLALARLLVLDDRLTALDVGGTSLGP